jgi:hypothetical protein
MAQGLRFQNTETLLQTSLKHLVPSPFRSTRAINYRATIVPATINKSSPTATNVNVPQLIRDYAEIPGKLNLLRNTGQI